MGPVLLHTPEYGLSVGVLLGEVQELVHISQHLVREGVLQHLSFMMDIFDVHHEPIGQEQLYEPVLALLLQGKAEAPLSKAATLSALVLDPPILYKPLDHCGDGPRGQVQVSGQGSHRDEELLIKVR